MKPRLIIGLLITSVLVISAGAQENSAARPADGVATTLRRQPSSTPDTPPAQLELPPGLASAKEYPQRMELVLQALSEELSVIAQAAREEKISHAQAEYLSLERYYVALTRFQFLRTLYQNPEEDTQRKSNSQEN